MIIKIGSFSKRHNSTKRPTELAIIRQPESITAPVGSTVRMSIEATGEDLTYQWYWTRPGAGSWSATTVSGNKTNTITFEATTARDGNMYRCVVTDASGNTVTSEAATFTVGESSQTIINQPESTAESGSWGTTLSDVELKEDTSLEEPVFRIGFSNWDPAYNYIYVPSWNRYYFVVDVTVRIGRIWEVSCRLDAAATYKADIQAATAFILYDATANMDLIDSRLMITTPAITEYVETPLSDYLNTTGVYCLSVVGACDNASGTQGARTYALSIGALKNVLSSVQQYIADLGAQDTDSKEAILSIGRQLVGAGNVMENIRGCTWIPWNVSAMGDVSNEGIWLGLFNTGKAGYAIDAPVKSYETSISIPWHFSDWRRNSPYTQVYLYIPFVGLVQLSSENLIGQSVVYVKVSINRLNGNCDFEVRAGDQIIGTYSATTGIGIPVGVSGISGETAGVGALAHVASMAVGGAAGAIAGAVAQISQIAPNVITAGNLSGGAAVGLDLNLRCYTVSHNTSAEPNTIAPVIGTPVFAHHSLSGKSGFVQTRDISIQGANMSDAVRQELNAMCDNGIFLE